MRKALLLLLLLLTLPAAAQTRVRGSALFECWFLLNAVSDNPAQAIPEVKARWVPLIQQDPAAQASFRLWQGEAAGLCYLFTEWQEREPESAANLLEESEMPLRQEQIERESPARRKLFARIQENPGSLAAWLRFVKKNGIPEVPNAAAMARAQQLSVSLGRPEWRILLEGLIGVPHSKSLPLTLTRLCRDSYNLRGSGVGLAQANLSEMNLVVPREVSRQFSPAPANLSWLRQLAKKDPYYGRAYQRIHGPGGADAGEEFCTAAALFAATRGGLMSRKQALRHLRAAHPDPGHPGQSGSPVAAILYTHLMEFRDNPINYAIWLDTESHRRQLQPGQIEPTYEQIIVDVKGVAGMALDGDLIVKVIPDQAAAAAGLKAGDRIVSVDGSSVAGLSAEEILDRITGPVGCERKIRVEHGNFTLKLR